jgi:hypothetical protein
MSVFPISQCYTTDHFKRNGCSWLSIRWLSRYLTVCRTAISTSHLQEISVLHSWIEKGKQIGILAYLILNFDSAHLSHKFILGIVDQYHLSAVLRLHMSYVWHLSSGLHPILLSNNYIWLCTFILSSHLGLLFPSCNYIRISLFNNNWFIPSKHNTYM